MTMTDMLMVGVVNLVMFPIFAFLLKRTIGNMLDASDKWRDEVRRGRNEQL